MTGEYIERRNGGYYVAGSRVSLDSVVYSFRRDNSPETIQGEYPTLKLSQIYGAIAFYLDHRAEVDHYLKQHLEAQESVIPLREADPGLWAKLERARQSISDKKS